MPWRSASSWMTWRPGVARRSATGSAAARQWTTCASSTPAPPAQGASTGSGGTVGDGIPGGAYWTQWQYNPLSDQATETDHSLTGGTSTTTAYTYNRPSAAPAPPATSTTQAGTCSPPTTPGSDTLYLPGEQITATTDSNGNTTAVTGIRFIPLPGGGRSSAPAPPSATATKPPTSTAPACSPSTAPCKTRPGASSPLRPPRGTAPGTWPDTNGYLGDPVNPADNLTAIGARQYNPATGGNGGTYPVQSPQVANWTDWISEAMSQTPTGARTRIPPGTRLAGPERPAKPARGARSPRHVGPGSVRAVPASRPSDCGTSPSAAPVPSRRWPVAQDQRRCRRSGR